MTNPTFNDGDFIITEEFAAKVTRTGRGWFAEVVDAGHPANGLAVFGDKWAVISMLVEKVSKVACK
jgi:hypothetical protein